MRTIEDEKVRVIRGKKSDAQYIKALEESNKVLSSENRRLVRLRLRELDAIEREKRNTAYNCAKCLLKN
jgi:DNA gyrase/topoisomerase IV subunit A